MTLHPVVRSRSRHPGAAVALGEGMPSLVNSCVFIAGAFLSYSAGVFVAVGVILASGVSSNMGAIPLCRGTVRAEAHSGRR